MSVERAGEVLKALKSSEHPYLHIIYWQCRRETDTNIATTRLNPTVSANYVFQRKKELETAFRTHQVNYPSPEVCEAIEKYFTGPPKFDIRESVIPAPIFIEQTPVDPPPPPPQPEQQPDPTPPSQGEQVILPPARQTTKREGCLSLPVLLGALLLVVTGLLIWSVLTDESEPVDRIVEVTREIESIVEVTVPPIEVTRIVEVINTVVVPVKETVVVVQTVPAVEVTKLVEVTPAPTVTPTPIARSLYEEDFDDGEIDPAFEVTGEVLLLNGVVQPLSNEWVQIKIGDDSWRDYTIEYDYILVTFSPRHCGQPQYLKVRDDNRDNRLIYGYGRNCGTWTMVKSGESISLPNSETDGVAHVSVILEENELIHQFGDTAFTVMNNGLEDGGPLDSGFIVIEISPSTAIDNLVITRND